MTTYEEGEKDLNRGNEKNVRMIVHYTHQVS